ncbi:MAG: polysaccharide pyruvyl transferase CsaB [Bacillota bacterium]
MRIVLSGYYGFDNAGDEALLTAISNSLRAVDTTLEITVLSGNPARTALVHGVRAVSRVNPLVLTRELSRADLLISGGGSLLQDVTGPLSIPYYLGIVVLAKLLKTRVVFYAQGVGPVQRKLSRWLIKLVANQVELITLRDNESAELLRSIGVCRPPVSVTADPVFSLRPTKEEIRQAESYLIELGLQKDQGIIGISIRNWNIYTEHKIAQLLDKLAQSGHPLLLIPLQHPVDLEYSMRIRQLMKSPVTIAETQFTSTGLMGLISHLKLLVGMRLHSLIFAACVGTPFEGISYDPKVETFLKQFNKKPLFGNEDFNPEVVAWRLNQSISNPDNYSSSQILNQVAELKEKADQNAMLVLKVLKGEQPVQHS